MSMHQGKRNSNPATTVPIVLGSLAGSVQLSMLQGVLCVSFEPNTRILWIYSKLKDGLHARVLERLGVPVN